MKYTIPFDKRLYIKQTKLTLPYIYSNERKEIKNLTIFNVLIFAIGIIILFFGSELSTLFFIVGIFGIFNLYSKQENYKRLKDTYIRNTKENIENSEVISSGTFEFKKDCLRFSTDYVCSWVNWKDLKEYKIKESNLLLIHRKIDNEVYIIGESEVTKPEFQEILKFVKGKVNFKRSINRKHIN